LRHITSTTRQVEVRVKAEAELEDTVMAKRAAEDEEQLALKAGQRPTTLADGGDALEFEDEFEDEFESEDEIMEAGVDGRPDAEREREEAKGMLMS
jgi:ribosome assembly protein RRB1